MTHQFPDLHWHESSAHGRWKRWHLYEGNEITGEVYSRQGAKRVRWIERRSSSAGFADTIEAGKLRCVVAYVLAAVQKTSLKSTG